MIDKNMTIMDIIIQYPSTRSIFENYSMACSGCMGAMSESLEDGARMHGINLETLVKELNAAVVK